MTMKTQAELMNIVNHLSDIDLERLMPLISAQIVDRAKKRKYREEARKKKEDAELNKAAFHLYNKLTNEMKNAVIACRQVSLISAVGALRIFLDIPTGRTKELARVHSYICSDEVRGIMPKLPKDVVIHDA